MPVRLHPQVESTQTAAPHPPGAPLSRWGQSHRTNCSKEAVTLRLLILVLQIKKFSARREMGPSQGAALRTCQPFPAQQLPSPPYPLYSPASKVEHWAETE